MSLVEFGSNIFFCKLIWKTCVRFQCWCLEFLWVKESSVKIALSLYWEKRLTHNLVNCVENGK